MARAGAAGRLILVAAECALVPGSVLLTADPDDLGALLVDEPVEIVAILLVREPAARYGR